MAVVTPLGLDVSIRFGRLGALMALAVTVLVTFTITFHEGVVLTHFNPARTDADAQKKLLDDYNSYTGNVVSVFGRPIEIFVALAVNVLVLRVLAGSLLRAEISWKIDALTLVLSGGVGYLISNGLNALNVQLRPPIITPAISAADLTYVADFGVADALQRSTNLSKTISERTPRNPITNTVLANLVSPRFGTTKPYCRGNPISRLFANLIPEYGFSQRDWQSRLLQEAIAPNEFRVVVNPSKKAANQSVERNDLPMNASLAADLFIYSMYAADTVFRWNGGADFITLEDLKARHPTNSPDLAARVFDLLPPETAAPDERKKREWFLDKSAIALTQKLNHTKNISLSDIVMEFSHVDVSPMLRFDALTLELEVDPIAIANVRSEDNSTWYTNVDQGKQCGPWPHRCMMANPNGPQHQNSTSFDPPAQVQVFGACVTSNGTEELFFESVDHNLQDLQYGIDCRQMSNSSLMVVSVGKRFVADAILQNKTVNASGLLENVPGAQYAVVTNLRRIYSFTIAKLSWDLTNLSAEYHAECAQPSGTCDGLRFPLAPVGTNPPQELIVGVDAVPMSLVRMTTYGLRLTSTALVQLHEPQMTSYGYDFGNQELAAEPLLPHNIGDPFWGDITFLSDAKDCDETVEERLQLVLNNHLYIEHGLQTAYTAATFFLLQNAVVKDVIQLSGNRTSLNFQQNTHKIELLASIPDQNAWLTLAGCAVLVLSLLSIVVWARTSSTAASNRYGGLGHVTTPHVVARVMLDSVHFLRCFFIATFWKV